jgi:uncharacterized membrane protein (UPF0127 family)
MKKIIHPFLRSASIALVLLLAPVLGHAQASSLIFERADIRITATPKKADADTVSIARAPIALNVELRGEESLQLEYLHTLNSLGADNGVMIALNTPAKLSLTAMKVYVPVDVIFVADNGTILQISPHVTLAEMQETIGARAPVKALLFVRDGLAAKRGIEPHDVVSGRMFTPAPITKE